MDDEGDSPPGCEDLFASANVEPKINQVLTYHPTACIGLEYVVEILNANEGELTNSLITPSFYICLLCDRRVDLLSNILKHLESPAHRLKYLDKYFPRAHALFEQADTCFEKWSHEQFRFMDSVVQRIESRKGRLKVSAFHRNQWDLKSNILKSSIDNGTHLRETVDLVYGDIDSPFDDDVVMIPTNKEFKVQNDNKMDKISPHRETYLNGTKDNPATPTVGSEKIKSLDKQPNDKLKLEKKIQLPDKPSNASSSLSDSVSLSPSPRKRSISRSRSRDRSRSKSRSRASRSRKSRSRSRSRSKDYSRSYSKSHRSTSHHRERSTASYYEGYRGSNSYRGRGGRGHRHQPYSHPREDQLAPETQIQNKKLDEEQVRLLWNKLDQELGVLQDSLQRRRAFYENQPENHPQYAVEWKLFWQRRFIELKNEGRNPTNYNFKPEWILFWHKRMAQLDEEEVQVKKKELKLKYQLTGDKFVDVKRNGSNGKAEEEETRDPVTFGWKKLADTKPIVAVDCISDIKYSSPSSSVSVVNTSQDKIPISSNDGKVNVGKLPPLKPTSLINKNNVVSQSKGSFVPSFEPAAGSSPLPSKKPMDLDILSVLRILVVLEDSLGRSLGPSITQLLSRALSLERKGGPGSATKLLHEDTSCVDLLDTSKEKLKGLLAANMLVGVNADAARRAIESVSILLDSYQQETNPNKPTSVASPSLDATQLIKNLKAAGFLLEPPATVAENAASFKNSNSSTLDNNLTAEDQFDQFTPTELKTLISNFKSLSASQQNDLVVYLGRLEAHHASKNKIQPRPPGPVASSFLNRSTSPLSMKSRKLQNDPIVNPTVPDPQPCLFPEVMKITGLTSNDLKSSGLPLKDLFASTSAASEKLKTSNLSPPVINLDIDQTSIHSLHYPKSPSYQQTSTAFPRFAQQDAATVQHLNSFVETLPEVPKNTLQQTRDPRIYRKMQSSCPSSTGPDYSNVQQSNQIYDKQDSIPQRDWMSTQPNLVNNQFSTRLDHNGVRSPNYFKTHLDPRQNRYGNESRLPQNPNNHISPQEFRAPLMIPVSPVREQQMQPSNSSSSLAARLDDSFAYFAKYGYQQ